MFLCSLFDLPTHNNLTFQLICWAGVHTKLSLQLPSYRSYFKAFFAAISDLYLARLSQDQLSNLTLELATIVSEGYWMLEALKVTYVICA